MNKWILLVLASWIVSSAAFAQVPAGSGTLTGSDRVKASGCGGETSSLSVAFTLAANGTWTADVDGEVFAGTSSNAGRVARLTFDGASLALLEAGLEDSAIELCEDDTIEIDSLTVTQAMLKVNKRGDRAKLQIKARASGTSSEGSGTGKFRAKATGAWQVPT
jgi:hypothetical protein